MSLASTLYLLYVLTPRLYLLYAPTTCGSPVLDPIPYVVVSNLIGLTILTWSSIACAYLVPPSDVPDSTRSSTTESLALGLHVQSLVGLEVD